jgi:hypothetical protein
MAMLAVAGQIMVVPSSGMSSRGKNGTYVAIASRARHITPSR